MSPERRRIVLDEDINWKLYTELQRRGHTDATAVAHEGIDGKKDGALFKALAGSYEPFVLVTWDNKMPRVHSAEIAHHGTTIAGASIRLERHEDSSSWRYRPGLGPPIHAATGSSYISLRPPPSHTSPTELDEKKDPSRVPPRFPQLLACA